MRLHNILVLILSAVLHEYYMQLPLVIQVVFIYIGIHTIGDLVIKFTLKKKSKRKKKPSDLAVIAARRKYKKPKRH